MQRKDNNIMRITNKELVNAFYRAHGCRGQKDANDIGPLLPFLLGDIGYNCWRKFIVPLDLKFELKKMRNEVYRTYTKFNKDLFGVYGAEYRDAIIEKMDEMEEAIENDCLVMRATIMRSLQGDSVSFKVKESFAAVLMFWDLAKCALDVWGEFYKNFDGSEQVNPHLKKLLIQLERFVNEYLRQNRFVGKLSEKDNEEIGKCATILQRRIVDWLIKDMKNEESEEAQENA